MDERFAQMRKIMAECGEDFHKAVPKYEYITAYPIDQLVELSKIQFKIMETADDAARAELHRRYNELRDSIEMIPNPPEKIMLWPKGKVPTLTEYKENPGLRHFHDPGFEPYMLEVLLPQDIVPKGAVVTIAGGEQGMNTINECYEICREFREKGYQGFILHSRPNNGPWSPADYGYFPNVGLEPADGVVAILGSILIFLLDHQAEKDPMLYENINDHHFFCRGMLYYAMIFAIVIFGAYGVGYQPADLIYAGF